MEILTLLTPREAFVDFRYSKAPGRMPRDFNCRSPRHPVMKAAVISIKKPSNNANDPTESKKEKNTTQPVAYKFLRQSSI